MARFSLKSAGENTDFSQDYSKPDYAATLSFAPNASISHFKPGDLTGNLTINLDKTKAKEFDKLVCYFTASGGARTVTFGTNFSSTGTVIVPSGDSVVVEFYYNGTVFAENVVTA